MTIPDEPAAYASRQEFALALTALNAADLVRLTRLAQIRSTGLPGCDWEDLLQDAIGRALDGSRRWPSHISLVVFLREVMRSLASEIRRKAHSQGNPAGVPPMEADDAHDGRLEQVATDAPGPERSVMARDMLARVNALFSGDAEALAIIGGLAEGQTPADIQAAASMTQIDYDSARRRIRRTVARAFPEKT